MIVILSILLILSCNNKVIKPELENDVVLAEWNGGKVTLSEFRDIYLETPKSIFKGDYSIDSLHKELNDYIKVKMILKLADSLQLDTVKSITDKYNETIIALCYATLIADSVRNKVITQEMIENIYTNKKYDYRISHILFSKNNSDNKLIDSIYSVLSQNSDLFSKNAEQYSDDKPTAQLGGDLGWMAFDDLPESFKDVIKYDISKDSIFKPFKSKFGTHIIKTTDMREAQGKLRSLYEEKQSIIKYLENKFYNKIQEIKYDFDDRLFRRYNVKIDTTSVDSAVVLFNYIKNNGYDESGALKEKEKKIVITSIGNLIYNVQLLQIYFSTYYPDVKIVNRHAVIESAHSMVRRILAGKAFKDFGYFENPTIIFKTRILIVADYIKYYIYKYIVPKAVQDFEEGKIETFPSLDDMVFQFRSALFNDFDVNINNYALDSIK
jgi:hypothetical protein